MKIKAALLSLIIISDIMLSGCSFDDNGAAPGETENDSSSETEGIPDEDALNGLKTADAEAERIGVLSLNDVACVSTADNTLIGWGLGRDKDVLGRPVDAVKAQEKYGANSALFIDTSEEKRIFLTFDEGYENGYTGAILDTLKQKGVKAAFFVTYDYCISSPDLVERMIAEGHIVGNHSYTHPSFPSCSDEETQKEVMTLHDYVKDSFGYEMKFFRFPMGEFSERTLLQLDSMGYTSVFWSFAYKDWNPDSQPSVSEALEIVTDSVHSGAIYLLHAVSKANSDALGDIIDRWRADGYEIADLEQCINN